MLVSLIPFPVHAALIEPKYTEITNGSSFITRRFSFINSYVIPLLMDVVSRVRNMRSLGFL